MEEEWLLDEAARLYAFSREVEGLRRRLYREVALDCCRIATELRVARKFPAEGREVRRQAGGG